MSAQAQPLIAHLIELRSRLLKAIGAVLLIFLCLVYFANDLYTLVAAPLTQVLPEGTSMIATDVAATFFTPFKLTLVLSFFVAIPVVLYQIWGFIAPGLCQSEKRLVAPLLFSSTLLFYLGIAFAYFVIFPLVFGFLTSAAPAGVTIATDISSYLDLVLKLFFAFGFSFEVPVVIILLCWTGITTPQSLRQKRPYVIVAAFVVGMLLTPPDVISQTLLAVPIWFLFEIGVLIASMKKSKPEDEGEEEEKA